MNNFFIRIYLFFLLLLSFSLLSCYEEYLLIINNESSYDVNFNLTTGHRTEDYILKAGEQYSHSLIETHSHNINNFEPKDNVVLSREGNTYTFNDIPPPVPIPASILNTLPRIVILSGSGAISTDPLTIEANQEIKTETIIKKDPVFSAKTIEGYPVQVDFVLTANIYMIILR